MEAIRTAIETAAAYLGEHPDAAISTDAEAIAVCEEGLRFRIEGPKGALTTDMATSVGGGASAPTPAWLMRAALASCDATLVAMEAARAGVELSELKVTVDSESDFRGVLGVDDSVNAGPRSIRTRIEVASANASEEQLRAIVERAEAHSPVRDALMRAVSMTTEVVAQGTEAPVSA
jgi:uncharacterized OsmC-like protein